VLALAEWRDDEPLFDPTCGSGTFVIEAALRATGRAPGGRRRFAFEDWPSFDASQYARVREIAAPRRAAIAIAGADRDPAAIAAATENAARAGVASDVTLRTVEARAAELPEGPPGLLVANPPYGRRLPGAGDVYKHIGALARSRGWRLAILTPESRLAALAGKFQQRIPLRNGGLAVWLFLAG
jgi:putative N6-adenine-specific DNA methylase